MIYDGCQEGGEGEPNSGSAYEYYQKIRCYTGWEYEYVYGSLSDMFQMLETGEIDMIALVTYSPERAEKYLFSSEPHGSEAVFFYAHEMNNDVRAEDPSTFQGKRIGVLHNSYHELFLRQWCEENGVTCDIVTYELTADMHAGLTNGDIDVMLDMRTLKDDASAAPPWKSLCHFPADPTYIAVSKSRPDLLDELNKAMANIISTDEYYALSLMEKYHKGTNFGSADEGTADEITHMLAG